MSTQSQQNAAYYVSLLILQYLQMAKASATIGSTALPILLPDSNIQFISFSSAPVSGHFQISYAGPSTGNIQWNDSDGTIQTALNSILPSPVVSAVDGSISAGLTITFTGNTSAVPVLSIISSNLLDANLVSPVPQCVQVGSQLPFDVQDGFNLSGNTAVGVQLDVLGKYAGVTRSGFGFNGPITLNDTDFLTFIQLAIIRNKSGSSLASIQLLLNQFFDGEIFVFDYQFMQMSYLIDTSIIGEDLLSLFVAEGLLPKPMAVGVSVVGAVIIDKFFAFRTYSAVAWVNTTPFQTYGAYDTSWLWLTYKDSIPAEISL